MDTPNVYSYIARDFDRTRYAKWPCVNRFYQEHFTNDKFLIEVGCGNGKNIVQEYCVNYELCDVTLELLEICKHKYENTGITRCDCKHLPYRSKMFDIALCVAVIHHLDNYKLRVDAILELCRISKSIVFGTVWAYSENKKKKYHTQDALVPWTNKETGERLYRYYHFFTHDEIRSILEDIECERYELYYEHDNWIFTIFI